MRYPDLAGEIREFFPVLGLVEDFKPGTGDVTGSFAGPMIPGIGTLLERLGDFRFVARSRPRRHGDRLRGRARVAGPSRGLEGAARAIGCSTPRS